MVVTKVPSKMNTLQQKMDEIHISKTMRSCMIKNKREDQKVQFTKVDIYLHEVILGDNPFCHEGPPIQIGKQIEHTSFDIDSFEALRRGKRRSYLQLSIPAQTRYQLLDGKYPMKEITKVISEIKEIQKRQMKYIFYIQLYQKVFNSMSTTRGVQKISNLDTGDRNM